MNFFFEEISVYIILQLSKIISKSNNFCNIIMSQSDLHISFIKNIYRQIYFEMAFNNPAITINGKIVIIAEEFKGIDRIIANVFDTANAIAVVF